MQKKIVIIVWNRKNETKERGDSSKPCNRNVYFLLSEFAFTFFCFTPIILHTENAAKEPYGVKIRPHAVESSNDCRGKGR